MKFAVAILSFLLFIVADNEVNCQRKTLIKKALSKDFLKVSIQNDYDQFVELLKPILIKRVSDTPGNVQVRNYIKSQMESYGWMVETHEFSDDTPYGTKKFANIIATLPVGKSFQSSQRHTHNRVVFACHYDSKFFTEFDFYAATDSAVPCALMLDMAQFFYQNFNQHDFNKIFRNIQFIFFDGEEAFKDWTVTDSIYGSRNYANYLAHNYGSKSFDSIDLFVLLDLLGADTCQFRNYFPTQTGHVYNMLQLIENKLIKKGYLSRDNVYYFGDSNGRYWPIEDDHMPFMNRILHLIASPFPNQWHKATDNYDNLNQDTIQDLRLILKVFMLEVLNVSVNI